MATRIAFLIAALACSAGIAACSSADPPSPPQGCLDFVAAWCNKNTECRPASDRSRFHEDCEFSAKLDLDCSTVKGLGSTYDACMEAVGGSSCAAYVEDRGLPLPSVCKGILWR